MESVIYTDHEGHLASPDLKALHIFAGKLELRRDQFQDLHRHPHYGLNTTKEKKRAIEQGAKLVKSKVLVRKCYNKHILKKHQEIKITRRLSISRDITNKRVIEQLENFKEFWTKT